MDEDKFKTLVSVCIATYKREKLLERLLLSITKQQLEKNIEIEVIVTDNDPDSSTKSIIEKIKNSHSIILKYFVQSSKNISLTRNMCVANSSGDYICFIDDDEIADENWVSNLLSCLMKFNADGAFGYVEPIFDAKIPDHFKRREFYFSPVGETGTTAKFFYTTNCIIKAEFIKSEETPFDPNYGLTGGEDVHLFERLFYKGAKFINCKTALTFEYIPSERASYKYLFNRSLRGGQSFARRRLERNNTLVYKMMILLKSIIMIICYSVLLVFIFYSENFRIKYFQILGASFGKLRSLLGFYKNLY